MIKETKDFNKSISLNAFFELGNQKIMQALPLLLVVMITVSASHGYVRVCYYTSWTQYRPGAGRFLPENVDPFLCTHVVFAFAVINDQHQVTYFKGAV